MIEIVYIRKCRAAGEEHVCWAGAKSQGGKKMFYEGCDTEKNFLGMPNCEKIRSKRCMSYQLLDLVVHTVDGLVNSDVLETAGVPQWVRDKRTLVKGPGGVWRKAIPTSSRFPR